MAYFVGTANSLHDLRDNVYMALTANGWTLTSNTVHKNGTYISLTVTGTGVSLGSYLNLSVGNAMDSANPTDFVQSRIGLIPRDGGAGLNQTSWSWPVAYYIHILQDPDEFYLLVNYGAFWQSLAFGKSPVLGNPGTGNWCHGSQGINAICYDNTLAISPDGVVSQYYWAANMGCNIPFALRSVGGGSSAQSGSRIHAYTGLAGGVGWSPPLSALASGGASSMVPLTPLLRTQPNAWNLEATLLPCQIFQGRESQKSSLVGELKHLRITRNDYLPDGEVITLGADRWKVYPAYRRNTGARDGVSGEQPADHSGTMAIAIRYDGP